MTIKELKKYLKNFKDSDQVTIGAWFENGRRWYLPHENVTNPIVLRSKEKTRQRFAVVGYFDDCLAHQFLSYDVEIERLPI